MNPAFSEVFHCTSRCVRRAFLCGWDPASGRDFEHRRLWIDERISELALYFGISVISSSVMSNHFHIVLRTEPQWVASLSDAEVARRWLCVFPGPGGRRGHPPEAQAIEDLCLDTKKLALCRSRLSDISWFMRSLNEPIARRANAEDECTGRFWEGRFKCRRLDGDAAILACMMYVDLNPVRAGMATTPESSDFTSGQDRIIANQARRKLAQAPDNPTPAQQIAIEQAKKDAQRDQWLVPFASPESEKGLENADHADPRRETNGSYAFLGTNSAPSFLSHMTLESYLELLDWTGRQIHAKKRGVIPAHLRPILERLNLQVDAWVDNVENYDSLFRRLAATLGRLRELAGSLGRSWLHGRAGARRLYTQHA
jgi:REP element-mobilizing transposase RayT